MPLTSGPGALPSGPGAPGSQDDPMRKLQEALAGASGAASAGAAPPAAPQPAAAPSPRQGAAVQSLDRFFNPATALKELVTRARVPSNPQSELWVSLDPINANDPSPIKKLSNLADDEYGNVRSVFSLDQNRSVDTSRHVLTSEVQSAILVERVFKATATDDNQRPVCSPGDCIVYLRNGDTLDESCLKGWVKDLDKLGVNEIGIDVFARVSVGRGDKIDDGLKGRLGTAHALFIPSDPNNQSQVKVCDINNFELLVAIYSAAVGIKGINTYPTWETIIARLGSPDRVRDAETGIKKLLETLRTELAPAPATPLHAVPGAGAAAGTGAVGPAAAPLDRPPFGTGTTGADPGPEARKTAAPAASQSFVMQDFHRGVP